MGTLIRHAGRLRLPVPVLALPVSMVQPPFRTPLVAAVGAAPLIDSRRATAIVTAIALPAVAVPADPKHRLTATAEPLPENRFAMSVQARPWRGWTTTTESWHGRTSSSGDLLKVAKPEPRRLPRRGSNPRSASTRSLHSLAGFLDDRRMTCACGADEVARALSPAKVQKTTFSDDR